MIQTLFGQPRGLATLFLTEMWERFTYYGMRTILILFMVASVADGGLGLDDRTASSIYGLYIAATYVLAPFGGWIADRLVGAQQAVVGGGVVILAGNTLLACGTVQAFFLGLLVIVLGVGLLKPNISAMVAQLYPESGSRRDAGFSIFYMGINLGAFLGSLLVPLCAAHFGWRWGFALPAIGMLLGLIQFLWSRHCLGSTGPKTTGHETSGSWLFVILFGVAVAILAAITVTGQLKVNPVAVSAVTSWLIAILAATYFIYLVFFAGLTPQERLRVYVMAALFVACATFYAGAEQAGASLNLFAQPYTERDALGWHVPAGVLQAANPLFTIVFAPVFAAVWLALGTRDRDLSTPAKFAMALVLMGSGFFVMYLASRYVATGSKVLPTWLILTYLLHVWGDLCLSPVGLSSMTKLAPPRFMGQVLGVWFLALALGNNLAGQLSGNYDANNLQSLPGLFLKIFWWGLLGAAVMVLLTPTLKRLMAGVK